ncbi:hypothetical protein K449DRAFT_466792 [Hypoxylon sp. EC38]|nr:hypothetical protein K449DRAFT_466792 [Hypoxylon sp. EC38]
MAEVPVIQILDKKNYFKQTLVPLPNALPLPPLKESSLRIRTEVLCLTSNNFTYCKLGDLLHWWDVHPIPPSTPAPYNDASTYGRINCWGYAKVLESTFESVPKGSYVWGYLPIGTLPLDFQVKKGNVPGQIIVTEPYRQQQLPLYNRYHIFPETLGKEIDAKAGAIAYDALARVMHLTGYVMTNFMFPEDPAQSVNLNLEQADLTDATIINFAPGSKVGLSFTYLLDGPPPPQRPDGVDVAQVMADSLQNAAIKKVGEREYFEGLNASWEGLREEGFKGLKVKWGEGMEAAKEGWDRFARNEVQADEGLVFKL